MFLLSPFDFWWRCSIDLDEILEVLFGTSGGTLRLLMLFLDLMYPFDEVVGVLHELGLAVIWVLIESDLLSGAE